MTQDEIIEMAKQAGFYGWNEGELQSPYVEGDDLSEILEAFARLVAAKEREDLCKYFQELEDKATSVRDKMYLSGVQFVIRARGEA